MKYWTWIAALLFFALGLGHPTSSSATVINACTYVVMDAEGVCPAVNGEGTVVCTACRLGELCPPSLECTSTILSCTLRMLARVQGMECGDCPLGANPLPAGFACRETGVERTPTPEGGTPTPTEEGGGGTPTPTATEEGGGGTPTPTEEGGGTPTATEEGGGGTPTPTEEGGGTPTPTEEGGGGTPTPTEEGGGTPTPTEEGGGGTPTPTEEGGGGTPTPTEEGGGGTPTPTATGPTPTRTATGPTRTPTRTPSVGGGDGEGDDGCQVTAPVAGSTSWFVMIPMLGLIVWRRRHRR